jgi:hypothetical protein
MPHNNQNSPFIISLEVSLYTIPFEVARAISGGIIYCRQYFRFFFSSSLSPSLEIYASYAKFMVVFWFIRIFTSILILLIFNFCSWSFCKTLIYLQFYHSISIWKCGFNQFDPHSFDCFFFHLLLNLFFLFNSPFNKKFIYISYFNFDSHSFDFF